MKKLLLSLSLLAICANVSQAYIEVSNMTSPEAIKRHGYSESMARIVDTAKAHQQGDNSTFKRRYKRVTSPYHNIKVYLDPVTDDGLFGEHEINYSNTWMGDHTKYASPLVDTKEVENL